MTLLWSVLLVDLLFLCLAVIFTIESLREKEPRAPAFGMIGVAFHLVAAILLLLWPASRLPLTVFLGLLLAGGLALLVPGKANSRALQGSAGFVVGDVVRADERDIVFARNRSLQPRSEAYRRYYEAHPEREAADAARRNRGGPLGKIGAIDHGYPPNVAMVLAAFAMPVHLGPHAHVDPPPDAVRIEMEPERASRIVKGLARHLGADLVGICRVDSHWAYSRRGEIFYDNWAEWGAEIAAPLPFAVLLATEMDHANVGGGPHTPAVVESAVNYAKGAFIATELAQWFGGMGFRAAAHHNRHYDLLMVPLAVDAGLGEYGRLGYLVADRYGPRVRLFAVTTDMPLEPDQPVDLGVEGFCRRCLKCAHACPSRSVPEGEPVEAGGTLRWKINPETCFDYWGKVGTDCSVCMGVCPFSRPHRSLHRLVRWVLKRSPLARNTLPAIDNLIYGRKWRSRPVPDWIRYDHPQEDSARRLRLRETRRV